MQSEGEAAGSARRRASTRLVKATSSFEYYPSPQWSGVEGDYS